MRSGIFNVQQDQRHVPRLADQIAAARLAQHVNWCKTLVWETWVAAQQIKYVEDQCRHVPLAATRIVLRILDVAAACLDMPATMWVVL